MQGAIYMRDFTFLTEEQCFGKDPPQGVKIRHSGIQLIFSLSHLCGSNQVHGVDDLFHFLYAVDPGFDLLCTGHPITVPPGLFPFPPSEILWTDGESPVWSRQSDPLSDRSPGRAPAPLLLYNEAVSS